MEQDSSVYSKSSAAVVFQLCGAIIEVMKTNCEV